MLPDHMRRRAADGDGGAARPLRRARIFLRCAWSLDQYLSDGDVWRRVAPGDHVRARAADGQAAAAFGLDPIEIRRRNLVKTFPHTSVTGLTFDEASYVETMKAAVEAID